MNTPRVQQVAFMHCNTMSRSSHLCMVWQLRQLEAGANARHTPVARFKEELPSACNKCSPVRGMQVHRLVHCKRYPEDSWRHMCMYPITEQQWFWCSLQRSVHATTEDAQCMDGQISHNSCARLVKLRQISRSVTSTRSIHMYDDWQEVDNE